VGLAKNEKAQREDWAFVRQPMATIRYPVTLWASGRRAREVIPAAM